MNSDRALVAKAVIAGQLPSSAITDQELVEVGLEVMELIMERKLEEGMMVFSVDDVPLEMYN